MSLVIRLLSSQGCPQTWYWGSEVNHMPWFLVHSPTVAQITNIKRAAHSQVQDSAFMFHSTVSGSSSTCPILIQNRFFFFIKCMCCLWWRVSYLLSMWFVACLSRSKKCLQYIVLLTSNYLKQLSETEDFSSWILPSFQAGITLQWETLKHTSRNLKKKNQGVISWQPKHETHLR